MKILSLLAVLALLFTSCNNSHIKNKATVKQLNSSLTFIQHLDKDINVGDTIVVTSGPNYALTVVVISID